MIGRVTLIDLYLDARLIAPGMRLRWPELDLVKVKKSIQHFFSSCFRNNHFKTTQFSTMANLAPDVLFIVFKQLELKPRFLTRRVCKSWLDVSEDQVSLWNNVFLDESTLSTGFKWEPSLIESLDKSSRSRLKYLNIDVLIANVPHFIEVVEKSKGTLQGIILGPRVVGGEYLPRIPLSDLCWKLPKLTHFVICPERYSVVVRRKRAIAEAEGSGSKLRILSIYGSTQLFSSHLNVLDNLVSLTFDYLRSASEWRVALEKCAGKLKHLDIRFGGSFEIANAPQSDLFFPLLEVLVIRHSPLPSWMKFPPTITLTMMAHVDECGRIPSNLPSVAELWTGFIKRFEELNGSCPLLKKLVVDIEPMHSDLLIEFLSQRNLEVRNGLKVDGIKMQPIETLVIWFSWSTPDETQLNKLNRIRSLVKEVIVQAPPPKIVEVEI